MLHESSTAEAPTPHTQVRTYLTTLTALLHHLGAHTCRTQKSQHTRHTNIPTLYLALQTPPHTLLQHDHNICKLAAFIHA